MNIKFKLVVFLGIVVIFLFVLFSVEKKPEKEHFLNREMQKYDQNLQVSDKDFRKDDINCPDLDDVIEDLGIYQPLLKDVERCYLKYAKRNKIPDKFYAIILPSGIYGRDDQIPVRYFENLEKYRKKFGFYNISPGLSDAVAPPYVYDNSQDLLKPPYIITPEYFERKMSAYIIMYLKEKIKYGHSFIFTTMYPPTEWSGAYQKISSKDDFKEWITNEYLKEVRERAKLAEKWGFEFYNPLPLELERLLSPFNTELKFLSKMSNSEIESLGQWTIDVIAETARKYFTGRLILPRYPFYGILPSLEPSPEPLWENLDMDKYDLISFSLIPECNVSKTREFAKKQLAYYEKLSQKESKVWGLGEVDIMADLYKKCGNNIDDIEPELWNSIIEIIEALPSKPSFVFFGFRIDPMNPQNPIYLDTKAFDSVLEYIKNNFNRD